MQIMIYQTQPESVEHLKYFGSITNYGSEIKSSIVMQEQLSTKDTFYQQIWIEVKEEISKMFHLEHSLYVAETCTLRKVERKSQGGFVMWWWKRMNISWTERVRNEEE